MRGRSFRFHIETFRLKDFRGTRFFRPDQASDRSRGRGRNFNVTFTFPSVLCNLTYQPTQYYTPCKSKIVTVVNLSFPPLSHLVPRLRPRISHISPCIQGSNCVGRVAVFRPRSRALSWFNQAQMESKDESNIE